MIKYISTYSPWIVLLFLFYFFGTLGIGIEESQNFFLPLTPLNLLLTLFIFFKINGDFSKRFLTLSAIIFLIGFSIEAVGTATGILFGSYYYGEVFGWKVFNTPLLIGVNWLFLSLSSHGVVQHFTKKPFWLIVLPSLLMTGLDFLIEPVAIQLKFWSWENNIIPFQNYLMWFLTSSVIHGIICLYRPKINAKISYVIIIAQLVFFGTLYLLIG